MSQPSYTRGRQDQALLAQTIGQAFDATVARSADGEALVCAIKACATAGGSWPHRSKTMHARSWPWACTPASVSASGRPTARSGAFCSWPAPRSAILVNINPAYRVGELEYVLRQSGCRWLVCADAFKTSDYHAMVQAGAGTGQRQAR
jgi:fatty-acyl-CoA synthase